jgi:cystathionine beta-lyase/cystathionine gamma-synthase
MVRIETQLVHESSPVDPQTNSVTPAIYPTSTYKQDALGKHKGWEYGRTGNPTRAVLERAIAVLEKGTHGFAFASGMATIDTVFHTLERGDHIVAAEETYGGTRRILDHAYKTLGVDVSYIPGHETEAWAEEITPETKMFFLETPSNPLLHCTDIRAVSKLAHEKGILVGVDNTFASPYLQRPLELGADFVVHSATKYLGGHSDLVAGVLATNKKKFSERIGFLQNAIGGICSPWDAWLVLRGLKTLHLRMQATCRNARLLADFLESHRKVTAVHYPGLKSHPQYALARRQMRMPGGMLSFEYRGTARDVRRLLRSNGSVTLAESLGSVETLLSHPWTMTHASIPEEARLRLGIKPTLIRISTGIEHVEDLQADMGKILRG